MSAVIPAKAGTHSTLSTGKVPLERTQGPPAFAGVTVKEQASINATGTLNGKPITWALPEGVNQ